MPVNREVSVIICAAGKGSRAGFGKNKLLLPLPGGAGETVLEHTVRAFVRAEVGQIVVAAAPCDRAKIENLLAPYSPLCIVTEGGETRTRSVKNALAAVTGRIVLVHDGARPYVSEKVIADCIQSVRACGSGVCALPLTDTAVRAKDGFIADVPPRDEMFAVQTPQGFLTAELKAAYEKTGKENYTDDSAVYAKFIRPPRLFIGEKENRKLTFAEDFRAPAPPLPLSGDDGKTADVPPLLFLRAQALGAARVGIGVDTHAFGKAQDYIVLAGVKIPAESGLIAHSDGDVLAHAVTDAALSAAGLRDIGFYFPDTDEKWRGADSMEMLRAALQEVKKTGFVPCNVSVAVQAQKPRLGKFIPAMSENLAKTMNIPLSAVGIAAGTNEGLGFVGEGKGITVTAAVLLQTF